MTKKFWSLGTPLGYLGSGSQLDLGLGACRFQILVIWGLNESPVLVALQGQAKNPKAVGAWCGLYFTGFQEPLNRWLDSWGSCSYQAADFKEGKADC